MKIFKQTTTSLLLASVFFFTAPAIQAENEPVPHTIAVQGYAAKEVIPDKAQISFGVVSQAPQALQAKKNHDVIMNKIADALSELGVPTKDISTSGFNVTPLYTEYKEGTIRTIRAYEVRNILTMRTTDLNLLTQALEVAMKAGANSVYDLNFSVSRTGNLQNELLKEAVLNGRKQAEIIALASGRTLGRLISADTQNYSANVQSQRNNFKYAVSLDSELSTPIFPGSEKTEMRLFLVYELI